MVDWMRWKNDKRLRKPRKENMKEEKRAKLLR